MPLAKSLYPKPQIREDLFRQRRGLLAESADGLGCTQNISWTTQDMRGVAVYLYAGETVTGVAISVSTANTDAGTDCFAALYDDEDGSASGTEWALLASSADTASAITLTSANPRIIAFSTPYTVTKTGVYYPAVLIVFTAGATPVLLGNTVGVERTQAHLGGKVKGFLMASQTSLPAAVVPADSASVPWLGVYG